MNRAIWAMMILPIVSACTDPAGDFCDVVTAEKAFDPLTARIMVKTDRPDVEAIRVENEYWRGHCAG